MHSQRVTTLTLESIEQFQSSLFAKGRSTQTVKAYGTDLRVLLQEVETASIDLAEMQDTGNNWLTANRKKLMPKTTQRRLTSLRAFCKWAGWGDLFAEYSAPTPARAIAHPLPEGMAGVQRLIAVAKKPEHEALIALCGMVGARIHEALLARPSDFDLQNMTVILHGKGDKDRIVPVSEMAWTILAGPVTRAFLAGDVEIIGLKDRFARRVITNLGVKANLQRPISSHDLRATFATWVFDKTLDRRVVQELLGHANGNTTDVYIGRSQEQMRAAVEFPKKED